MATQRWFDWVEIFQWRFYRLWFHTFYKCTGKTPTQTLLLNVTRVGKSHYSILCGSRGSDGESYENASNMNVWNDENVKHVVRTEEGARSSIERKSFIKNKKKQNKKKDILYFLFRRCVHDAVWNRKINNIFECLGKGKRESGDKCVVYLFGGAAV